MSISYQLQQQQRQFDQILTILDKLTVAVERLSARVNRLEAANSAQAISPGYEEDGE